MHARPLIRKQKQCNSNFDYCATNKHQLQRENALIFLLVKFSQVKPRPCDRLNSKCILVSKWWRIHPDSEKCRQYNDQKPPRRQKLCIVNKNNRIHRKLIQCVWKVNMYLRKIQSATKGRSHKLDQSFSDHLTSCPSALTLGLIGRR